MNRLQQWNNQSDFVYRVQLFESNVPHLLLNEPSICMGNLVVSYMPGRLYSIKHSDVYLTVRLFVGSSLRPNQKMQMPHLGGLCKMSRENMYGQTDKANNLKAM